MQQPTIVALTTADEQQAPSVLLSQRRCSYPICIHMLRNCIHSMCIHTDLMYVASWCAYLILTACTPVKAKLHYYLLLRWPASVLLLTVLTIAICCFPLAKRKEQIVRQH